MALLQTAKLAYTAYQNRTSIKRLIFGILIAIGVIIFILYLIVATAFAVIQGQGGVSDGGTIDPGTIPFTEFESFTYKTIYGQQWYEFTHPYYFPTLGRLTQGVILDTGAAVGLRHIAWDIADRRDRVTEVKSFADGTVVTVNTNMLLNTTRRWRFCDSSPNGICWYEVAERADIQYACGYEIIIQHEDSLRSQYCHLASKPSLESGNRVLGGQTIGIQGSTGWATGKHLHFALSRNGQPIDPSYAFTQTSLDNWGE